MPTTVTATYRIVPVEAGRWGILRDHGFAMFGGEAVLANQDYPSPEVAAAALRELAGPDGGGMVTILRADGKIDRIEMRGRRA